MSSRTVRSRAGLAAGRAGCAAACAAALLAACTTSGGSAPATPSVQRAPKLPGGAQPLIREGAPTPTPGPDGPPAVIAHAESQLFPQAHGDVADDMAVVQNADDPAAGLVVAADKSPQGGVALYDVAGRLLGYQHVGKIGNIDARTGVELDGREVTLVAANDRTDDTLRLWSLDVRGRTLGALSLRAPRTVSHNYGSCLGRTADGRHTYALVSQADTGLIQQFELRADGSAVVATEVRRLEVGSQAEGCAVDDRTGALYVAEEDRALWRYDLDPASGARRSAVDRVGAGHISDDLEGVTLARGPDGRGVLVASSQGDSTFAVYDLDGDHAYRGSFRVRRGGSVDGVTHTDGLALAAGDFGPDYPNGLLVVHDGENHGAGDEKEAASNLKFIRFDQVFALTPTG